MGDNRGAMNTTTAANVEMPTGLPGCTLFSRLEREWKVTRTNTNEDYSAGSYFVKLVSQTTQVVERVVKMK